MITRLFRDPTTRIALMLWAGTSTLYFLPGVPADFLERLGDRYSTLPLWPWAIVACLIGTARLDADARRFWTLQAASFFALLAIEVPWALAAGGDEMTWNIAAEWCYFAYFGFQLMSAGRSRSERAVAAAVAVACAAGLTALAWWRPALYEGGWPSYLAYLGLDMLLIIAFWRRRRDAGPAWTAIYTAFTAAVVVATVVDGLDLAWYLGFLPWEAGMKTDIVWMLPPLAFILAARFGHQHLDPAA